MTRSRTIAVVRIVVAAAVVVALVWGVARNWTEISQDLQRVSLGALLLSFVPAAVGTWLTMLGWRVVLADLGSPLHVAPAGGVVSWASSASTCPARSGRSSCRPTWRHTCTSRDAGPASPAW